MLSDFIMETSLFRVRAAALIGVLSLLLLFPRLSTQQQLGTSPLFQQEGVEGERSTTPGLAHQEGVEGERSTNPGLAHQEGVDEARSTTPGLALWVPTSNYQSQSNYQRLSQENLILQRPDSSSETSPDFLLKYCSAFCVNQTELVKMDVDATCLQTMCVPCSCEKPWCYFYGLCCPDVEDEKPSTPRANQDPQGLELDKEVSQLDAVSTADSPAVIDADSVLTRHGDLQIMPICEKKKLLIRNCPAGYNDEEIKRKCEQDTAEPDIDDFTRVTVADTGVSFYNTFCAQCNGFTEVTAWEVTIDCFNFQKVYQATDELAFLHLSMQTGSDCPVVQRPPVNLMTGPECFPWWFENVVSSCNVTGFWSVADEILRDLCENTVKDLRYRVMYGYYTYVNLYCFMCNNPPLTKYVDPCVKTYSADGIYGTDTYTSPFALLLGTSSTNKSPSQTNVDLLENVEVQCSPGKLVENNTCITAIDKVRGLSYKMFIFYTPMFQGKQLNLVSNTPNFTRDDDLLHSFVMAVVMKFSKYMYDFLVDNSLELKAGQIFSPTDHLPQGEITLGGSIPLLYFDAKFTSTMMVPRDEVENTFVSAFFFENLFYEGKSFNINFQPMISSGNENQSAQCFDKVWYPQQLRCQETQLSKAFEYALTVDDSALISLTPLLTCPFVKFNTSDYKYPRDSANLARAGNITLNLQGHSVEVQGNWTDMNLIFEDTSKTELKVCYSLLREKLNNIVVSKVMKASLFIKFRFYFSQVCIGISMFCLALTLITYLSFRVLRSPAGMNNLFLCFSLLAAQAFLLAIVHMRPNDPLCTAVGVTTHFLWLNMFCWAVVCCFHMFQTFTSKTRSGASTNRAKMLGYIKKFAFCTVLPLLVISAIMVTSNLTKGDGSIGYGKIACYLDSQLLALVGMVAPLSLMVIANIVFFIITVSKIRSVRKLQGNMDVTPGAPKDIYVYVKLSSLTGCFWVLSVAAEYLDNVALKVVSDVLVGLQGAFIFWSYVCNERVLNLYRKAFGMTVVITSRTGTITRVARDVEKVEQKMKK